MLTIICGEDNVASRRYFADLKTQYTKKDYNVQTITAKQVEDIAKQDVDMSLFGQQIIYATESVNALIGRQKNDKYITLLKSIAEDKSIHLIDWENGKSERELKIKTLGTIKEFKVDKTIFQLQDSCYEKNIQQFLELLRQVNETQDEGFIYAMLCKHIRTLILASQNKLPAYVQPWQKQKLYAQSQNWHQDKLILFYEGLARIDQSLKTSSNAFGIKRSVELLACYFLV